VSSRIHAHLSVQNDVVSSIFWVKDFSWLNAILLLAENFNVNSRVSILSCVKFAAPDYVYRFGCNFCKLSLGL